MRRGRKLYLAICDYNKNVVCDLYDNQSDISGQAVNVYIDKERNGFKELSFDIPSTCSSDEGEIPNYRLDYLIAEYKIKAVEKSSDEDAEEKTDWYFISEPKITRNKFSRNVSVRASHISQLLKNKSLDLEFSDEEGNNVGRADALLETILEGTGWRPGYVEEFKEDDGSIKVRSLEGQAGTGALNFIDKLCDAFEAKPIYNGDMTVDIISMNPFAKTDPEDIPKALVDSGHVIELYYDRNVHNLTKTTNTENMVTRLYAYGSSGDSNGACTLQNATHVECIYDVVPIASENDIQVLKTRLLAATTEEEMWAIISSSNISQIKGLIKYIYEYASMDLVHRVVIDAERLTEKGWQGAGTGIATVFSQTYVFGRNNPTVNYEWNENVAISFTPILPTGTVLSPDELDKYIVSLTKKYKSISEMLANDKTGYQLILNYTEVTESFSKAIEDEVKRIVMLHLLHEKLFDSDYIVFSAGTELRIVVGDTYYFFKTTNDLLAQGYLVFSLMDISSQTYVWDHLNKAAYKVSLKPSGEYISLSDPTYVNVKNKFPYLLALKYYSDVGLLTDELLQEVALFQREVPGLYQISENAAANFVQDETDLSKIAESNTGFLKFKVTRDYTSDSDGAKRIYIDDVLYRTDYDKAERRYFQWHIAKQLKANGDPVSGTPSVVFIIHDTNPVTWDRVYLKCIYDQNGRLIQDEDGNPADFKYDSELRPGSIAVWSNDIRWDPNARYYLFCTNSMSGLLGIRQTEDEAVVENLQNTTMDGSEEHPTYFVKESETLPRVQDIVSTYAWCYRFKTALEQVGSLYFYWPAKGDTTWRSVYIAQDAPSSASENEYFYSLRHKTLSKRTGGQWVKYTSAAEQRVANSFSKVFYYCRRRDMLHKGLYEYYFYDTVHLDPANYAIPNEFAFYWTFTTKQVVEGRLKLDTIKGYVYQDNDINHIVTSSVEPLDTVFYPTENELDNTSFILGTINTDSGVEEDSDNKYRSTNLKVWENTTYDYDMPANSVAIFYTISLAHIKNQNKAISGRGAFTTPPDARYVRFVTSSIPSGYVRVQGYDKKFYINDKPYTILSPITTTVQPPETNKLIGIIPLTEEFADLADKTYGEDLVTLQETQQEIKTRDNEITILLGDMLKDGRWQDSNYIKGDEKRLYDEATDMTKQISEPEITYSFTYLDMFGVKDEHFYEEHDIEWPDIDIIDVAHLVDMESKTNCWAYIDKVHKGYDKEWDTSIEVDTKLTLAARHSFTDVVARIAEVAKDIKSKQPEYDRAATGSVAASRLEGAISLFTSYITGGSSNWYTDARGNIVFESADGLSAMMLGGRGLCIANSKNSDGDWNFRTAATGYGITADEIYTGYLSADRIEASSITADKLMANVGQELDIGSNKALALFATVNGSRPAGTVLTTDGLIEIIAGYQSGGVTVPAKINVISGGELNLEGGMVNIKANGIDGKKGTLNVESTGLFTLKANGADSLDSDAQGIYIGSDGVNFGGGKFKLSFSGNTSTLKIDASLVQIGSDPSETLSQAFIDEAQARQDAFDAATAAIEDVDGEVKTNLKTSIIETVRVYKTGTSKTTPPSLNQPGSTGADSTWTEDVKSVNSTNKYLWSRNRYKTYENKYTYGTAVMEAELGNKIEKSYPQYARTTAKVAPSATSSDWKDSIPGFIRNETTGIITNPYVWACTRIIYTNGDSTRVDIHQDEGSQELTNAAILGTNIAAGIVSVPKVSATGITISDDTIKVEATSKVQMLGNSQITIGSSSANNAVVLNADGITIASGANIAIISGGTVTVGSVGKTFDIGSDKTNAYIRNGRTSVSDTSHDGIYLGTDGINVGKASGSYVKATADGDVYISGSIYATGFELAPNISIPHEDIQGLDDAGVTYSYQVSNSGTQVPTGTWSPSRPTSVSPGQYVWTKIVTKSLTGTTTTEYACEYYSKDGTNGKDGKDGTNGKDGKDGTNGRDGTDGKDGGYITTIQHLYYLKSNTTAPSKPTSKITNTGTGAGSWTLAVPIYVENYTYFCCEQYTWTGRSDGVTMSWSDVYTDYGLTSANKNATTASAAATNAATTVEPFTHDGLSYGTVWGGVEYGVVLSNSSNAKPMLIGSNSGITIAKSASASNGAALAIDSSGIGLYGSTINLTTSQDHTTNNVSMNSSGITIATGAAITIESGSSMTVKSHASFSVESGGTVDLSGATVSLSYNQLSNKPNIFVVPTGVTIAQEHVKIYSGNNYFDITPTTVEAKGAAINLNDLTNTNYVHITNNGIDIKGSRVTITDASGETCTLWGRDDIVVMNPNETDPTKLWRKTVGDIESHMADKHDWVLIRPYYNAKVLFNISGIYRDITEYNNIALTKNSEESFGDAASGYSYDVAITVARTSRNAQPGLYFKIYAQKGSSTRTIVLGSGNFTATGGAVAYDSSNYNIQMSRLAEGIEKEKDTDYSAGNWTFKTTLSAGAGAEHNLAGEDFKMYINIGGSMYGSGFADVIAVDITANCNASTKHVPCTVYYYT